jgi:hypothetical protein
MIMLGSELHLLLATAVSRDIKLIASRLLTAFRQGFAWPITLCLRLKRAKFLEDGRRWRFDAPPQRQGGSRRKQTDAGIVALDWPAREPFLSLKFCDNGF